MLTRLLLLTTTISLAGCAIRPLPEDVSGVATPVIVKQVCCETRQAVKDIALGWLTADANQENRRVDPRARAIGFEFLREQRPIQQFEPKLFQGHVRDVVDTFFSTGVAYTFGRRRDGGVATPAKPARSVIRNGDYTCAPIADDQSGSTWSRAGMRSATPDMCERPNNRFCQVLVYA